VAQARAERALEARVFEGPKFAVARVEEATVPGAASELPARLYVPEHAPPAPPLLVYLHGGGWVIGDLDTHDNACRFIAAHAGVLVLSVGYRLAPEHRFPAAVDDAIAAYRWARSAPAVLRGDGRVAIGGDSMGGCLAAVVMQELRGDDAPDAALLVYPMLDPGARTPSRERFGVGYLLTTETMDWFHAQYLGDAEPHDPRAAPGRVLDALAGLPPTLVATAGFDPLRDEADAYARALAAAGVHVEHRCFADQVHGFLHMTSIPSSLAATVELAQGLRMLLPPRR
jgi:acetyl esterase